MMGRSLRALWGNPRPAQAPGPGGRDWMLVAVFVGWSLAEALLRDGLAWRPLVLAISVVVALTLPWRRTHPLRAVVVAFGTLLAFDVLRIVAVDGTGLASIAAVLLLPYALFRWGAGREAVLGLTLILSWLAVTHIADPTPPGEVVAAVAFFLLSAALGAAMRFQAHARTRAIEQATLRERSELARELHDASVTMCRRSPSRPRPAARWPPLSPNGSWACSPPSRKPPRGPLRRCARWSACCATTQDRSSRRARGWVTSGGLPVRTKALLASTCSWCRDPSVSSAWGGAS